MDVTDQKVLQEWPNNIQEVVDFLGKQLNWAMNYSGVSNVEHEQP